MLHYFFLAKKNEFTDPEKEFNKLYDENKKNKNIIYIDDSLSEHEQILVCAHELGHMLLHKKANALFMDTYTGFNTTKYEKEADLFAMELLVPDETFLEYQEYTTEQIALALGYTEKLIKLRLKSK